MAMNNINTRFIGGIGAIPTLGECYDDTDNMDLGDYKKFIDAVVESDIALDAYVKNINYKPWQQLLMLKQALREDAGQDLSVKEAKLILFLLRCALG